MAVALSLGGWPDHRNKEGIGICRHVAENIEQEGRVFFQNYAFIFSLLF